MRSDREKNRMEGEVAEKLHCVRESGMLEFWLLKVWNSGTEMWKTEMTAFREKIQVGDNFDRERKKFCRVVSDWHKQKWAVANSRWRGLETESGCMAIQVNFRLRKIF